MEAMRRRSPDDRPATGLNAMGAPVAAKVLV
jgi:hypothetical protein